MTTAYKSLPGCPCSLCRDDQPSPKVAGRFDRADNAEVLDYTDSYMKEVHEPEQLLALATEHLEGVEFDTLVGTGLSGTIAVTDLARRLGKNYLVVRKANDGSHSSAPVEGKLGKRWLFVDDLVSSGATFGRVWDVLAGLQADRQFTTEFVGVFLYSDSRYFVSPSNERIHSWLKWTSEKYDGRYAAKKPEPKITIEPEVGRSPVSSLFDELLLDPEQYPTVTEALDTLIESGIYQAPSWKDVGYIDKSSVPDYLTSYNNKALTRLLTNAT